MPGLVPGIHDFFVLQKKNHHEGTKATKDMKRTFFFVSFNTFVPSW
jgi:hypothetical protein